jgi:AcrR family transcriptional regulator
MNKTDHNTSRWERRKERTHQRLLTVADALFREQGFDPTTVEQITQGADVAKGTFFNYFETKEELLINVLVSRLEQSLETLPGPDLPAPERIRLTLQEMWKALYPYRHLTRHLIGHNVTPHSPSPKDHRLFHVLLKLVRTGQEEGTFREDAQADVAVRFLIVHFLRLCFLTCRDDETSAECWEEQLEDGLDILFHGLVKN